MLPLLLYARARVSSRESRYIVFGGCAHSGDNLYARVRIALAAKLSPVNSVFGRRAWAIAQARTRKSLLPLRARVHASCMAPPGRPHARELMLEGARVLAATLLARAHQLRAPSRVRVLAR